MNQMRAGDLVFAAPTRRARGFADADQPGICMDLHKQEWRSGVRTAAAAADCELRLERDADRN